MSEKPGKPEKSLLRSWSVPGLPLLVCVGMLLAVWGRYTDTPVEPVPTLQPDERKPDTREQPERRPDRIFSQAVVELETALFSPSVRIRRIAAIALSRLQRQDANAALKKLLAEEKSALARVEIAFALARQGDETGRAEIRRFLLSDRRDVRLDAAGALASIGDSSGRGELQKLLRLKHYRLSASVFLAKLGDEQGLDSLHDLASGDDGQALRMRATVALAEAGDESVRSELTTFLAERKLIVGAASALASLGEHSVIPELESQLALPGVRVRAAIGLRKLGHRPPLGVLAAALDSDNEISQITAAEALLVLLGPGVVD